MNQIKIHQIKNPDDLYFNEFWRIYSGSFPLNEKRFIKQQAAIFKNSAYQLNIYISGNQLIGFISFWMAEEFTFTEHLAIAPELRNQGKGKAILKSFVESNQIPIILEIEPPVDNTTCSRLRFYTSQGFKLNNHKHLQPTYHNGDEPVPMKILTYPAKISDSDYQLFARFQKDIVLSSHS